MVDSTIINTVEDRVKVRRQLNFRTVRSKLLYRGSRDNFKAADFHTKVDDYGATITNVKSTEGNRFSAFTSRSWEKNYNEQGSDTSSFLYSVDKDQKYPIKQNKAAQATYHSEEWGVCFGNKLNPDLGLGTEMDKETNVSNVGETYELPDIQGIDGKTVLAGKSPFACEEVEVFQLY